MSDKWVLFIHEINLIDIIVCSIVKFIRMMLKFVDHFDLKYSFLFLWILVIMGCCCWLKEHFVTYYYQYIKNTLWVLKRRISIYFLNRELPVSRMISCKICSDMMMFCYDDHHMDMFWYDDHYIKGVITIERWTLTVSLWFSK